MSLSKQKMALAPAAALTLDHVWIAAALVLLALRPLLTAIPPHDFWWHIATGRLTVMQGAIPTVDTFSYTRAGTPFYNQGWLAQVLMYGLFRAGGVELLLIVQALVIVLAYGLLLRLCIMRSGRLRLSVTLLLLTTLPVSFDNWTIRPQSYAFPLFAMLLTILTEYRLGRANRLWLLPLLMVLWVNIHGSFVLGLGLIGVTFAGEVLTRWRSTGGQGSADEAQLKHSSLRPGRWALSVWGIVATLAVLLNPRGVEVIGYVRNLLGASAVTALVTEWSPPTVRDLSGAIFFLYLIGLAVVLIYARRRPDLTDMLLTGAFLWLALGATRSVVWFGFVATPLLVTQAATLLPPARSAAGRPGLNAALVGLLGTLLLIGLPWVKPALVPPPGGALLSADTPVEAVSALRMLPNRPQRLFHAIGYGSYMIWAAPEQKVFIDPRIELYPYEQWVDYINLGQANNVALLMQRYGFDGLLLDRKEQKPLIDVIHGDPAWAIRYEDEQTILLTRAE